MSLCVHGVYVYRVCMFARCVCVCVCVCVCSGGGIPAIKDSDSLCVVLSTDMQWCVGKACCVSNKKSFRVVMSSDLKTV